jgi:hypothetical protein
LSIIVHSSGNKGSPNRSRADCVDTDILAEEDVGKTTSERDNGTLGGGVVEKDQIIRIDGGVVDDSITTLHLRSEVLGQEPERVNVGVEGLDPVLLRQVLDGVLKAIRPSTIYA